ncbi:ShlB/FhaC/HecB family hemolysin secretion/activation protein [Aquimarina sp. W85]|uniref:ShlB/FhaC/HecB family hemolysin secretion/activation protein n=1 Tax=Aquimarina rhodophyticola TaxID=3342246 RepID=UPI00367155C7
MRYFSVVSSRIALLVFLIFCVISCATYQPQWLTNPISNTSDKTPTYTLYLASGLGNAKDPVDSKLVDKLEETLKNADKKSTMIFLGDNVTPKRKNKDQDFKLLEQQLQIVSNYKGRTLFIPGNNEWKTNDIDDLEEYEDYIKEKEQEKVEYQEKNGCPLEYIDVNDQLAIIVVNSPWFIANWNKVEEINKKCTDIFTRRRFAEELEGYINDAQDKNVVIAMHHPVYSNGEYAGKDTFSSQLLPLPLVGNIYDGFKDMAGFSPEQLNARRYRYLRILVSSIAKKSDRVTIVSGHEENLQYLKGGQMHQIISGSLGSKSATKRSKGVLTTVGGSLEFEGVFTQGKKGFAKVDYFEDGSSEVTFLTDNDKNEEFRFAVLPPFKEPKVATYEQKQLGETQKATVLTDEDKLDKSGFYKVLWGERYRDYFGTPVTAKVAYLDTLHGGLTVQKEGGGHQSFSLRLTDSEGKQYAMRSLRKNALKFLKFKVRGIAYTAEDYKNTMAEDLISDFFTTTHPFMQLVIDPLAKAVDVNHSNAELYYIPKQERLGEFNTDFGDELYFIEERPSEEQKNFEGYNRANPKEAGKVSDFESTTDMLEKIKEDESYTIDQRAYVRARIFDMLIGDWDRHQDQWRWMEYTTNEDDKTFIPIPRDRDNTFSKFDGIGIPIVQMFMPNTRFWQSYDSEINNIKWYNAQANDLDRALVTQYGAALWKEEAKKIQKELSAETIDAAFLRIPKEVQDSTASKIKQNLKSRLTKLDIYAQTYGEYLDNTISIRGTHKDDHFLIERLKEGKTKVTIKRKLSDEKNKEIYSRTFDRDKTKELWIYGLNDDDTFEIIGEGDREIFIRIIGGYGKDRYITKNKKRLKVYDWKFEDSDFDEKSPSKYLSNLYETNTFHWRYFQENHNVLLPTLGYNPDDGFFLGAVNTYTNNGFNGNPFRYQHKIGANYYFLLKGIELSYKGEFANIFPQWNFEVEGYFTNELFANNFFGFGNESVNTDDDNGLSFNRARMQQIKFSAGIRHRSITLKALYESFSVKEEQDRYFTEQNINPLAFDQQQYVGSEAGLYYYNQDAKDFPTEAVYFGIKGGYKANIAESDNQFGYVSLKLGASHKLIRSGHLVLGTTLEGKTNIGDNYLFYHAPSIGGNNGLRGFRNERFSGKAYFYQSTDLKLRVKRFITAVAPITFGVYGGFDYGRVWVNNDDSNTLHTSQGGGLWISGLNALAFNIGVFNSEETNMVQVGFGFGF